MPELKFKAVDTSLAMEEVQRKLGPDALILSTERRDGMIEIVATNEPDQIEAANLKAREKLKVRRESGLIEKSKSDNSFHKFPEIIEAEKAKYDDNLDISTRIFLKVKIKTVWPWLLKRLENRISYRQLAE